MRWRIGLLRRLQVNPRFYRFGLDSRGGCGIVGGVE
jgi:hypothetical protein